MRGAQRSRVAPHRSPFTWPPFCAHPDARAAEPPGKVGVWCRTSFLPRSPPLRGMRGCRRAPPVAPKAPRKLAHVSRVKIVASHEKMSTRAVLWTLVAAMIVAAVALAADGPCRRISVTALALLIAGRVAMHLVERRNNTFQMHLVAPDAMNESLLLEANLAGTDTLFLIDTGYAGPPVISASYLAIDDPSGMPLKERYEHVARQLARAADSNAHHGAIHEFLRRKRCAAYTSGCTMRLMGIGDVSEQQADMMLCEALRFRACDGSMSKPLSSIDADVFVTNRLSQSIHILTCDYLVHSSPVLLDIGRGVMRLFVPVDEAVIMRARMTMQPLRLSGGAFVVPIELGGATFQITVDTGAPGPVSLGKEAAKRLQSCVREKRALTQEGVNGERICSEIIRTDMHFCGHALRDVPVFVNDATVEGVDGYVGMGVLRAFDMLVLEEGIGFAHNGLALRSADTYAASTTARGCRVELSC